MSMKLTNSPSPCSIAETKASSPSASSRSRVRHRSLRSRAGTRPPRAPRRRRWRFPRTHRARASRSDDSRGLRRRARRRGPAGHSRRRRARGVAGGRARCQRRPDADASRGVGLSATGTRAQVQRARSSEQTARCSIAHNEDARPVRASIASSSDATRSRLSDARRGDRYVGGTVVHEEIVSALHKPCGKTTRTPVLKLAMSTCGNAACSISYERLRRERGRIGDVENCLRVSRGRARTNPSSRRCLPRSIVAP